MKSLLSPLWIRLRGQQRDLKLTWLAIALLYFGFGIYSATYYNFATEALNINPVQLGHVEALREVPGFLCVLVAALTMALAEPLLAALALFLMAIGMGAYAGVNTIGALMFWSFVWSVGLHTWFPLQSSLVLGMSKAGQEGNRLGQTGSVASLGTVGGMVLVLIIGKAIAYHYWFLSGSVSIALAAVCLLFIRRDVAHLDKPRFVWNRKYTLYYGLTFLEGCRKQVFITFAIYALTREYHTSLRVVALLMVVNGIVSMIGAPLVGKLIDRIGERKILMTCYSFLILVFLGYATIHKVHVLYVLYALDNLFYLSSPCLTTYLQKIADPQDLMPSLSLGVTLNHTAAVLVPLIGGMLWASQGYPVTFFGGAVVVAISLVLAARLRTAPVRTKQ